MGRHLFFFPFPTILDERSATRKLTSDPVARYLALHWRIVAENTSLSLRLAFADECPEWKRDNRLLMEGIWIISE
jgi:hypothetical protein